MNKKFTSTVIGKNIKDKKGKTVLEKIIVHEIRFVNGIIKADSKLILKGEKQSVIIKRKPRKLRSTRKRVHGINLLTGELYSQGGAKC